MSDEEFTAAIQAITAGVPSDVAGNRLAHLVRALVESGGAPAADLLRMVVQMRQRADAIEGDEGDPGFSREWDMS